MPNSFLRALVLAWTLWASYSFLRALALALTLWASLSLSFAQSPPSGAVLSGATSGKPPTASTGSEGNFFLDYSTSTIFGPKAGGIWPPTPPNTIYPTIIPAYSGTYILTTGSPVFTIDAATAANVTPGMAIISAGFPSSTIVGSITGTIVTAANYIASPNSTVSGPAAVSFGQARIIPPFIASTQVLAAQGLFGSAAQGNTTWEYRYNAPSDAYLHVPLVSMNDAGNPAAYFAAHSANLTSAANQSTYPMRLDVWADNLSFENPVWAFYGQCGAIPSALWNAVYCGELSPVNLSGIPGAATDPYTNNPINGFETLRLDAGNGFPGLSNISDIIHLIGNGAKAQHGIDVASNALDTTADPHAPALALPQNIAVTWYNTFGKTWQIYDATVGNVQNTLSFNQNGAAFSATILPANGSVGTPGIEFCLNSGTGIYSNTSAVEFSSGGVLTGYFGANFFNNAVGQLNHIRTVSCASGSVSAVNGDFSIEINAMPAGNCTVNLLAGTGGQQIRVSDAVGTAATHNIIVTPAAGNVDGSTTYTINTNWGSWTGEWNTVLWKTVAKL